jgi:hypothetical protein
VPHCHFSFFDRWHGAYKDIYKGEGKEVVLAMRERERERERVQLLPLKAWDPLK